MATECAFSENGSVLLGDPATSVGRLSDWRRRVEASGEGATVALAGSSVSRCTSVGDEWFSPPPSIWGPAARSTSGSRVRMMSSSHWMRSRAELAKLGGRDVERRQVRGEEYIGGNSMSMFISYSLAGNQ